MKKYFILFITLFFVAGCSVKQTSTDELDLKSQTANNAQQTLVPDDSTDSNDSEDSADLPNSDSHSSISDDNLHASAMDQTHFTVTESNIEGYHDLITDVHDLNLGLDLTDSRLAPLIDHLSHYDYNLTLTQIGEISVPDSLYVLADKLNHLPSDYVPEDLRVPDVRFPFEEDNEKKNLRDDAATALENLFQAAEEDNLYLFAVSGYRSYNRQTTIYNYKVSNRGLAEADKVSSRPGHSEHQTGLAMDISAQSVGFGLEYEFGDVEEGIWVSEHAYEYGFIIRYPKNQSDLTGYNYEPWHLRYIGEDLASYLHDHPMTLEELYASLLNQLKTN